MILYVISLYQYYAIEQLCIGMPQNTKHTLMYFTVYLFSFLYILCTSNRKRGQQLIYIGNKNTSVTILIHTLSAFTETYFPIIEELQCSYMPAGTSLLPLSQAKKCVDIRTLHLALLCVL